MKNTTSKLSIFALLSSVAASLCCILPVIALFSGISSVAVASAWFESFRGYLIGFTILILGFAWYHKLLASPKTECSCESDNKTKFIQSKLFLSIVTVIALGFLSFPYSVGYFQKQRNIDQTAAIPTTAQTYEYRITNMTCTSCATSIRNRVAAVPGVIRADVSYEKQLATITFHPEKITSESIEQKIRDLGYPVTLARRL